METWPADLPQKIQSSFELKLRSGLVEESEERNPLRNRTYPEYEATFSLTMSTVQLTSFLLWWENTLNQTAPFLAPWLILIGFSSHFLKFTSTPSWKNVTPNYWEVSLPVEIITNTYNYMG